MTKLRTPAGKNGKVVVIGSGATGMVAAVTAAQGGAEVTVLEKMRNLGGSSNFTEGMFAVESDMQRNQYLAYTRDEAFKAIMEYNHWRANARLVRAFVDESGATIGWLQQQGVDFVDVCTHVPNGRRVWHVLKGPERERGSAMIKVLADLAKRSGVDIRLGTPAMQLRKANGKTAGVKAGEDGTEEIGADAVIVATGGYGNNKEWIKKYCGFELGVNLAPLGNVNKMGDGIRMAWEAGAAEEGMGVLQLLRSGPSLEVGFGSVGALESAAYQPCLHVNQHGVRYCDESISCNFPFDGNAISNQKGKFVFTIFDDDIARQWQRNGTDIGTGRMIPPGSKINVLEVLKQAEGQNARNIFIADSVEELAAKMGLNPTSLKTTVEEYNHCCETGHDSLFAKDRRYLQPLKGPQFYALRCRTIFLGTLGGIKVNERLEVLDTDERPIPGLYAGGLDAGGIYGDSYDIQTCGGTLGFAVNSGRIAARNALQYLSQAK
jgi:fumarate reductase flavoprotein subunit